MGLRIHFTYRIGVLPATTALATGVGLFTAPTTNPCWQSGGNWWCNNVSGAAVYKYPYTFEVVGYMHSNPNWFKCSYDFGATVGGPHPKRHANDRVTSS